MLRHLVPPTDPRNSYDMVPLGGLAPVTQLDDLVTRIVAPNASPMTLDGTNTYLVGSPGSGLCVVIDPGPIDGIHLERIETELIRMDAEVAVVLVTHHHVDHAGAARSWASRWGCRVAAESAQVAGSDGIVLGGVGRNLRIGAINLEVVPTPGHCADHVAFRLESGSLFSGDHVLGRGTTVLMWPDGDLIAYIESLRTTLNLGSESLYPGHGPELVGEEPNAVIRYYIDHRTYRESQIIDVLLAGPASVERIVRAIYIELRGELVEVAGFSTRVCLKKMESEDRVRQLVNGEWEVVGAQYRVADTGKA